MVEMGYASPLVLHNIKPTLPCQDFRCLSMIEFDRPFQPDASFSGYGVGNIDEGVRDVFKV